MTSAGYASPMMEDLNCYLVGGAVRDELLGRPVKDCDWVVVGSTVGEMKARGFSQVGRDFPVFLHPDTHEEYALARTERRTSGGHQGFEVFASPETTLEEDLVRRDLTVNAIAKSAKGDLIDPFHGQLDIEAQVLRHVSRAFSEDPLRVLRVARFSAELEGFTVAPETLGLMQGMCAAGELRSLSAERIWQETERALAAPDPSVFFAVLDSVGGLSDWFPELDGYALQFRPGDSLSRFVDLALEPARLEPLCARIKIPGRYRQVADDVFRLGSQLSNWWDLSPQALADAFERLHARHDSSRLKMLRSILHIERGDQLEALREQYQQVRLDETIAPGPEYGAALAAARLEILQSGLS